MIFFDAKKRTHLFICALSLGVFLTSTAYAKGNWTKEDSSGGTTIFSRPMSGSDINMFKAVSVLPYSPDQVVEVLSDIDAYKKYMPNVAESRILKSSKRGDKEVIVLYQRLSLPTVNDRDFIVESETWSEKKESGNLWRITFKSAPDEGPKPVSGVVRVRVVSGAWTLEPIQGGTSTRITVTRHVELGGNIPDFMVNNGIQDALEETIKSLRKQCKKVYGK